MKLKPIKRKELKKSVEVQQTPEEPKKREKKPNKLPPDAYNPMYPPVSLLFYDYVQRVRSLYWIFKR